jgi:hypothetical protein
MAGFEHPQDAVRASIEMIEELSRFNRTASRRWAKVGVQGIERLRRRSVTGSTISDRTCIRPHGCRVSPTSTKFASVQQ